MSKSSVPPLRQEWPPILPRWPWDEALLRLEQQTAPTLRRRLYEAEERATHVWDLTRALQLAIQQAPRTLRGAPGRPACA